jgi:Zn-dependent metalloprotease/subtilisin family serine protease
MKKYLLIIGLALLAGAHAGWAYKPSEKKPSELNRQGSNTSTPYQRGLRLLQPTSLEDLRDAAIDGPGVLHSIQMDKAETTKEVVRRLNQRLQHCNVTVRIVQTKSDELGNQHIRLQQYYRGIPVVGAVMIVHVKSDGDIFAVTGKIVSEIDLSTTATIPSTGVHVRASQGIAGAIPPKKTVSPQMVIFDGHLAYETMVEGIEEGTPSRWRCYIDAQTGEALLRLNEVMQAAPGQNGSHETISGTRLSGEDGSTVTMQGWRDAGANYFLYHKTQVWGVYNLDTYDWDQRATASWGTSDPAGVSLAKNMAITQDYVQTVLGLNSFNNAGIFAQANSHEGTNYVNAYWDGSDFHFGDGDGVAAAPLTVLDIAAHEYGHAITQYSSDLVYSYESGALNESYSDILGTLVEMWAQPDGRSAYPNGLDGHSDWLCGEDSWLEDEALRDLRNPQRYANPSYYHGTYWYTGSGDNGGVHYNSGVQNFAAYLLAEGGTGSNDGHPYSINGLGVPAMGRIAMYANIYLLTSSARYRDARDAWILAATTLGYDAGVVEAVWTACGIAPMVKNLAVSPATLNFGTVAVGTGRTMNLTLSNSGGDATIVSSLAFTNANFRPAVSAPSVPFSVPGGGSVRVGIMFLPPANGPQSATLTIASNAADNPSIQVPLQGTGAPPPHLTLTPTAVSATVPVGGTTTRTLTIGNTGSSDLLFSLDITDPAAIDATTQTAYDATHFIAIAKGTKDPRTGRPTSGLSGGPDSFGYRWKDSDEPTGPSYIWEDISTSGSLLSTVSGCDDCYQSQAISFPFEYYGNTFSTIHVSSNGYITLGTPSNQIPNYPLPSSSAPVNLIAALHDDLNPYAGGDIYFRDFGDRAIVQFNNVYPYNGSGLYTFQMILYRSGQIRYYYNNLTGDLNGCTVGIQDQTQTIGLTVAYNTPYLKNRLAVEFSQAPLWVVASPQSGSVAPGGTIPVSLAFDATSLFGGSYAAQCNLTHNDPAAANPAILPITLQVDGMRRLNVTPTTCSFGTVLIGNNGQQTITLTNSGDEVVSVSSITSTQPSFSHLATLPLTVPAFGSRTVVLQFAPSAPGSATAALTIASNAEDNPSLTVTCSGQGTPPPTMVLTPTTMTFNLQPGDLPADRTAVLANNGGDLLHYQSRAVEVTRPLSIKVTAPAAVLPVVAEDIIYSSDNYSHPFSDNGIIVGYKSGMSALADPGLLDHIGVKQTRALAVARSPRSRQVAFTQRSIQLLKLAEGGRQKVLDAIALLRNDANVAYAEPDYLVKAVRTPNDPSFGLLYGMHNSGQNGGTVDADIDAPEAWDTHTGAKNVLIGIIDTGIDYLHPDLAANMWHNPGEVPGNGVDDDGNGFIDDVYGWDFAYDDSDPMDGHYHGTHCAGTIAGAGNNGTGVAGVMWNASLVAIKFLDDGGSGSISDAVDAVNYANAMDIQITSNSWGGGGFSQALMDAIAAGGLFIAAAGNDGVNNDTSPHYPSSYTLNNIIAVAATDNNDARATFSCYGPTSVDLAAPGVEVYSCAPGSSYQYLSGTSMATPHVSGAAGLVWSYNATLTALQVKQLLMDNVDPISSMNGMVVSNGRLNVAKALAATGPTWLKVAPTSGTVAGASQQNLTVTVDPTGLAAGVWQGQIVVQGDDPANPSDAIEITATIAGCRHLVSDQAAIAFGSVWQGTSSQQIIRLTNNCNAAVTVSALTFDHATFRTSTQTPLSIGSFATIELPVIFTPSAPTPFTGTLTILSNAEDNPTITVTLNGAGIAPPALAVSPSWLSETVFPGGSLTRTVTITNLGGDNLNFTVTEVDATVSSVSTREIYDASHFVSLVKGAPDTRVGRPVTRLSGGPDEFGYRWRDSDDPSGPDYVWEDISTTGSLLSTVSNCDDCYESQAISFPFEYYGSTFSTIYVSSNGYITLGTPTAQIANYPLPSPSAPANLIAALHDDLYPSAGGDIYFKDFGDRAIVQFNNVIPYTGSGLYTFQMVLYSTGTIRYYYQTLTGPLTGCTVGIQNQPGTIGLNVAYNTTYLKNGLAVEFAKRPRWLSVDTHSGTVSPGSLAALTVSLDATELTGGIQLGELRISHNDPSLASPIIIPVTLTISNDPVTNSYIVQIGSSVEKLVIGQQYRIEKLSIGVPVAGIVEGNSYRLRFGIK